jgi:hypothetical protein
MTRHATPEERNDHDRDLCKHEHHDISVELQFTIAKLRAAEVTLLIIRRAIAAIQEALLRLQLSR